MNRNHLLVTLDYPPEQGGVARYLGNLVRVSKGCMQVLVPHTHALSGPGEVSSARFFWRGPIAWLPLVWTLWCRRQASSLLVSHLLPVGTSALLARLMGGAPYLVLVHGLDVLLAEGSWRKRWLAGCVLRGARAVVANSGATAERVRAVWRGVSPHVITPGVEPRSFLSRLEARAKLEISSSETVLLTVARLEPRKGMDRMIEALATFPSVRYVVIGEGADRARLEALASVHAQGRVLFLGACSDAVRDLWLKAGDVFAFLAREEARDVEGFGIACLEASLAGLPVLAGRSGGVGEAVLHDQTGLLVRPTDLEEIRVALGRLLDDPALRSRFGEAGRIRAQTLFRWEDRFEAFRALL